MSLTTPELRAELKKIKTYAPVGVRYHHYKNAEKTYRITGHGFIEATVEPAIIYQSEEDKTVWIRPAAAFLENVKLNGTTVPRFTRLVDMPVPKVKTDAVITPADDL